MIHFNYLYIAVSWVLLRWHDLFTAIGLSKDGGVNWALSIVALVITARVLLFRFFIKQVHYQRRMMQMQPRMTAIKAKYKDDRAAQQRELMKLQQEEGFNPLTGCLPMFLQIPVFISLFHVLRHLSNSVKIADNVKTATPAQLHKLTLYTFTQSETVSAAKAKLFGAPLAAAFRDGSSVIHNTLGGNVTSTRLVILPLLFISAGATLATQLLTRANAPTQPEGSAATIQRLMLWLIPVGVLASGLLFNFPLGVLLYWFTSNLWTLGQQAYIIRYHPHEVPTPAGAASSGAAKALAPKPGAKPVRGARGVPPTALPTPASADAPPLESIPPQSIAEPPGSGAPGVQRGQRPPQRSSRPAGNRPSGQRPTKAKKRR